MEQKHSVRFCVFCSAGVIIEICKLLRINSFLYALNKNVLRFFVKKQTLSTVPKKTKNTKSSIVTKEKKKNQLMTKLLLLTSYMLVLEPAVHLAPPGVGAGRQEQG